MIHVKNIHKYYNKLHVLKGVELHIKKEEIAVVVGASGAGKTTLLHILGTLDKPSNLYFKENDIKSEDEKVVLTINGNNILEMKDNKLANFRNLKLGFIFQFHHLLPEFTALENVCIPGFIAKKNKNKVETDAKLLLDYLGLSQRMNHKPSELSGGEQQRVAVARALINKPDVVFADEPSGNLDTKSANMLHELFYKLRNDFAQTFVIVTHNEELTKMANKKITMADGQIKSVEILRG